MERPPDLFDREAEWSDLMDFVQQPGPGKRLALVRGRRRQGKSFLLRRLTAALGGFYYQALEQEPSQALESIRALLSGRGQVSSATKLLIFSVAGSIGTSKPPPVTTMSS